ncbi:PLAC8 family [Fragilaria crotonensis]|nr:PLAC8 family [Fragilaria crotonensis]
MHLLLLFLRAHLEQQHAATSESLARKQLLAELREASTLMAESQTPEAAEFWKNHVISLQARLRSLHNETDSEVVRPISPPRRPPTKTSPRIEHNRNVPKSTKEELLSTPNYGPPKYSTEFFHPPLENPETAPRELTQLNYVKQQSGRSSPFVDQRRSSPYLGPAPPLDQSRLKHSEGSDPAKHLSTGSGADRVDVVSPADLPAGYQFEAEIDGHRFLATVPFGGAKRGETFSCIMRDLAPSGRVFPPGLGVIVCAIARSSASAIRSTSTQSSVPFSLGQIMTRLKLDAFGRPTKLGGKTWSTMWTITIFWIAMNVVIYMAFNFKWVHHLPLTIPITLLSRR